MKKILLMTTLCLLSIGMSAQSKKIITGAVIDKNGNPLPNALVEATGGAENVTTDADGTFRIEVSIWLKSLTAKYAGLKDKTIKLKNDKPVIFEMSRKNGWGFLNIAYSANFGNEETKEFNRVGLMGGYLGNWGGYAKVMIAVDTEIFMPSSTIGVIKRIVNPAYIYFGAGYSPVFYLYDYYYFAGSINAPAYGGKYFSDYNGVMFDTGVILKFKRFDINAGYSASTNFDGTANHSVQVSFGYCF